MKLKVFFLVFIAFLLFRSVTGTEHRCQTYGTKFPDNFEPSGLSYHEESDLLVSVGDEGNIAIFPRSNTNANYEYYDYSISNKNFSNGRVYYTDYESVTIKDDIFYIGLEYPVGFLKWNMTAQNFTGEFIPLPDFPIAAEDPWKQGMESATYVPYAHDHGEAQKGYFYTGSQYDGNIYIYEEIADDQMNLTKTVDFSGFLKSKFEVESSDISGMYFFDSYLFILVDELDLLIVKKINDLTGEPLGTLESEFKYIHLVEDDQEGIVVTHSDHIGLYNLYIALDVDGKHEIAQYLLSLEEEKIIDYCFYFNSTLLAILIPIVISVSVFVVIFIAIILVLFFFLLQKQKKIKQFKAIEDIDLLLQEQKIEEQSIKRTPKLKINKSLFEVDYKAITVIKRIGKGGSDASVFQAKYSGKTVVYKCFHINSVYNEDEDSMFEKEVSLMSSIHHPHICQFFGATLQEPRVGILMEWCSNGDFRNFLISNQEKNSTSYPLSQKIRIMKEVCSAVGYLHSRNIIHRDLKSQNILITKDETAKLADFGISKIGNNSLQHTKRVGTSLYMAPEMVFSTCYDEKVDSFSFAITIFEIITEEFGIYDNKSSFNLEIRVSKDPTFRPDIRKLSDMGIKEGHWLREMIVRNWNHDPKKRNTFEEMLEIFKKEKKKETEEKNRLKTTEKSSEELLSYKKQIEELKKTVELKDLEIEKLREENEKLKKKSKEDELKVKTTEDKLKSKEIEDELIKAKEIEESKN